MSRAERLLDLIQVLRRYRQPVSGRLRTQWGADERFEGWLGFVDALKRLQEQRKES